MKLESRESSGEVAGAKRKNHGCCLKVKNKDLPPAGMGRVSVRAQGV